jgi:dipeptidase
MLPYVWATLSRYQNAAAAISRKTPFWATSVINLVQRKNRQDRTLNFRKQ